MNFKFSVLTIISCILLSCSGKQEVFIEAEAFDAHGGWAVDQQFMDEMGSPYLIAHGLGKPVEDAVAEFEIPSEGRYHVYVRTYNWTSPWSSADGPGRFCVTIDGKSTGKVLGCRGSQWEWQYAGSFRARRRNAVMALHDLTGFDGRCDAVFISNHRVQPESIDSRRFYPSETNGGTYDLVVAGGGVAGMCAAVAAARSGLKVALVHDRPVLGGNNSSEVRVHLGGMICLKPFENLGNLVKEFGHTKLGNAQPAENYEDEKKMDFVRGEDNITLLLDTRVVGAEKVGTKITSVIAVNCLTGERKLLSSRLFADCTGDASLGCAAGADFFYGREGRAAYGEPSAPEQADSMVLGSSVQWYSTMSEGDCSFPEFEYGMEFCDSSAQHVTHGEWTWECGMNMDMIHSAEKVRDYGMLAIYSNWSYLKNRLGEYPDRNLEWVGYVLGKRESRRLAGDYVLNENDVVGHVVYPDGTASTSWSIDLHYPDPENSKYFPGAEFKARCIQTPVDFYPVPYRCLYSRNVDNLFMAGRNISVSHIALGTTRVMRTTAMLGEVVGLAASVCHDMDCNPRDVLTDHFDMLVSRMTAGSGDASLPDNQRFNEGR